jgi:cytoskeletal protein CcmA (bactofilin family)
VNSSGSRAVTIIGAGVRVSGNIAFSGFLRIHGEVHGDIRCDSDSDGTTVVHGSGSVKGTIRSPNIVIGGRVDGPLYATESVEIHPDATVVGDISYKKIAIHAGGVIDGVLIPNAPMETGRVKMERRILVSESKAVKELDVPVAHDRRSTDRFWSGRKIGVAVLLIAVIVAAMWMRRHPATATPPAPPPAASFEPEPLAKAAPVLMPVVPAPVETPHVNPAPAAPEPRLESKPVAPPPPSPALTTSVAPPVIAVPAPQPERPRMVDSDKVVTITGMDSTKPGSNFFVISKTPAVLYRKLRRDSGQGMRIEVPRGANMRIAIAESEVLRVDQGPDIELFYQGRKVPPKTVESGTWMNFVPISPGDSPDEPR